MKYIFFLFVWFLVFSCSEKKQQSLENINEPFNEGWKFHLGDVLDGQNPRFDDATWRDLSLPHDWSIEGEFSEDNPATPGGGALPGGIGWYRKSFQANSQDSGKLFYIRFDGVYQNSEVWINGHSLGIRPNGYISFQYDLTPSLNFGNSLDNVLAVRVANSPQPNSRWYSGSGIYRNVWLSKRNKIHMDNTSAFITTPFITEDSAIVALSTTVLNKGEEEKEVEIRYEIKNQNNKVKASSNSSIVIAPEEDYPVVRNFTILNPDLWSVEDPKQYTLAVKIFQNDELIDISETKFGIRYFDFDPKGGFSLNGKNIKIKGVCDHHDLGCLGTAVNKRALERQLEILRGMGVNAIRTSHNPPAPELLDLCDKMGFIVMDEAFDMWKKGKTEYDYHLYWDEWHEKDLTDFIKRDRNHPSVLIWSIGNEILEQWDSTGIPITKELVSIVRSFDTTRAITSACNPPGPFNNITRADAMDLIGYNYHHAQFADFLENFPGKSFIATETTSALATRGHYDLPSDTVKRWPIRWDIEFTQGNPDNTVSAYDQVSTPWGSTHEETWRLIKKYDFLSGMFIWTGFDYLGEPTPYGWPSRSSYFGVVDLAGFPKDSYYMYKSEWTNEPVLHIFPHWNWKPGQDIDIWAYTNEDSVELFVNGVSKGFKKKSDDEFHIWWRVKFEPGQIMAQGYKNGQKHLQKLILTASEPYKIGLEADRPKIQANGRDLSFVTVSILDKDGTIHPNADDPVEFEIEGPGKIVGVDNGNPVSHESFKAKRRKAFHGLCLVVVQSTSTKGEIVLKAKSPDLQGSTIKILSE